VTAKISPLSKFKILHLLLRASQLYQKLQKPVLYFDNVFTWHFQARPLVLGVTLNSIFLYPFVGLALTRKQ